MKEKIEEKLNFVKELSKEWFKEEKEILPEKIKEIKKAESEELKELREKISKIQIKKEEKEKAGAEAEKLKYLSAKEKVEKILVLAATKGLAFAVETAKKLGDPLVLDLVHDILAKDKNYQKFL